MTTRHGRPGNEAPKNESAVWIDNDRAIVVRGGSDDLRIVEVLTRRSTEEDSRFETRTADQVLDAPRVIVSGPSASRLEFERTYVALTHRPDRLADDDRTTPLDAARPPS